MLSFVLVFVMLTAIGSAKKATVLVQGPECRSMKDEEGVLKIESLDSIVLSLDLNYNLAVTSKIAEAYERTNDTHGSTCARKMNARIDAVVKKFETKILEAQDESQMLHLYLRSFLKKGKRDVGSMVLAFFMSVSSLVALCLIWVTCSQKPKNG